MSGIVYLVGAGPGDPGLLTRKAERLLGEADVIVIDALVSPEIRALIPSATEVIEAGKRASKHTLSQEAINQLLVEQAQQGRRVVRLKGGDPFVFGRGGEEAELLAQHGVRFEIVPGISSAIAGPAYAGIPVTHRSLSTSFTVVTGHESDSSSGVDWPALASLPGTIVFLMGLAQLPSIVSQLIAHGRSKGDAIAVIASATTPRQKSVTGTLETIVDIVASAAIAPPALIVVGEVVTLRGTLNWFEKRPLSGKSIVVTRAREQASRLATLLEDSGARVVQYPMIEIAPPDSFDSLDGVIAQLDLYDWLIFTSSNGVESFFQRLTVQGRDSRALHHPRIAAIGQQTADELRQHGIVVDLLPERFQSSALLPLLPADQRGVRSAVIRAARGNDELLDELRRRGGEVTLAVAYQSRSATGDATLRESLQKGEIAVVTFTSGSTVENFFEQVDGTVDLSNVILASIGPLTSGALRRHAGRVDVEAEQADIASLHDAVVRHLGLR